MRRRKFLQKFLGISRNFWPTSLGHLCPLGKFFPTLYRLVVSLMVLVSIASLLWMLSNLIPWAFPEKFPTVISRFFQAVYSRNFLCYQKLLIDNDWSISLPGEDSWVRIRKLYLDGCTVVDDRVSMQPTRRRRQNAPAVRAPRSVEIIGISALSTGTKKALGRNFITSTVRSRKNSRRQER